MVTEAYERLLRHATKRVGAAEQDLAAYARREAVPALRGDGFLLPESMSIGYHTGFWQDLREEERLALNHWVYTLMYTRISDGEIYVLNANREVARYLRPHAPAVADLLDRESREEVDHIEAFGRVRAAVAERLGTAGIKPRKKPLRGVVIHPRTIRLLLRLFGADFVVLYFTARGIANHMGKGFETPLSRFESENKAVQRLTLLHTLDESNHMAVSRLIAACGRELVPAGESTGSLRRRLFSSLTRSTVTYTFSEGYSKTQERRMARQALPRMRALSERSPGFVEALIEAHFASVSGIERSRNAFMPRPNERLLDDAALAESDKQLWRRLLQENQGNLVFLPAA